MVKFSNYNFVVIFKEEIMILRICKFMLIKIIDEMLNYVLKNFQR